MTGFHAETVVERSPADVAALLLDEDFLGAFADRQHPDERSVAVHPDRRSAEVGWKVDLQGELPAMVTRLVGRHLEIAIRFVVGEPGRLDVDAYGKYRGEFRGTLALAEEPHSTRVSVDGDLDVQVRVVGAEAERLVRDHVLGPILRDQLFVMLRDWQPA